MADLYLAYQQHCSHYGILPASKTAVGICAKKLFPSIIRQTVTQNCVQALHYKGLRLRRTVVSDHEYVMCEVKVPEFIKTTYVEPGRLTLAIPRNVLKRRQNVFFQVSLSSNCLEIQYRLGTRAACTVDLAKNGMSQKLSLDQAHLDGIVRMVQAIPLCQGIAKADWNTTLPSNVIEGIYNLLSLHFLVDYCRNKSILRG